jgi:hypothetical protein
VAGPLRATVRNVRSVRPDSARVGADDASSVRPSDAGGMGGTDDPPSDRRPRKRDAQLRRLLNVFEHLESTVGSRVCARDLGSYSEPPTFLPEPGTGRSWSLGAFCRVQVRDSVSYGSQPWLCGAWARTRGRPCQAGASGRGGRCKFHGGESTGPRTAEGRQRISEAQRARWALFRRQKRNE